MKYLEWLNVLTNIGSSKMRLAIKKICEDSKKEPLIINNKSLLSTAEELLNHKKLNGNQLGIWARTIFEHKNAYKYAYERQYGKMVLIDRTDKNTYNEVNKFIDFIVKSNLYNKNN